MKLERLVARITSPLIFHLGPLSSLDDFERHLGRLDQDIARKGDAYFFGVESGLFRFALQAGRASFVRSLARRSGKKPCGFVTFEASCGTFRCSIARLDGQMVELQNIDTLINRVRNCDLISLIEEKRDLCVLIAPPGTHFVTPSGTHCEKFVRVANALNDPQSLFRMAYWLQDKLNNVGGVLIDTWGIVPVALEVMRLLGRSFNYDCLPAHAMTAREESIDRLNRLFNLAGPKDRVIFLQSLKGSGQLLEEIHREVAESELDRTRFQTLSIYGLPPFMENNPVLAFLPAERSFFMNENQCELCRSGLEMIRIDPKLYYVVAPSEHEVTLTPQCWNKAKPFFERYHGLGGILRVHADHPHDSRHHAFYIDVRLLLQDERFKQDFLAKAMSITPRPDVVVSPRHSCGRVMANLVSKALSIPKIESEQLRRSELTRAQYSLVTKSASILFVDDVFITGTRLRGYLCGMREDFFAKVWKRISFLSGIARPNSPQAWKDICSACSNHGPVQVTCEFVEFLLLPNWPQRLCPWCREYDFLSRCSQAMAAPPGWLIERIFSLTDKAAGIGLGCLFFPGAEEPVLGSSAVVGPAKMNATATLFATAAALQHLRHWEDPKKALAPGLPVSNVFNVIKNFGNYSEALVRAALLRCLRPDEFPSRSQRTARDYLAECCRHPTQRLILGELILAISRRGVIPPDYSVWASLVSSLDGDFAQYSAALLDIRK